MAWTNTDGAVMQPAKEANVKCPQDCHIFSEDKLMRYSYPSGDDVNNDGKNSLSWLPGPATSACGLFYSASRCLEMALWDWHGVHACGHSKWFTHLSCGGARANVSRYMLCPFLRKAKGPLGRTDATELSVWTSTDSVVLTRHLHSPMVSTPHFSMYVILAATVIFFGNGKNKVINEWMDRTVWVKI